MLLQECIKDELDDCSQEEKVSVSCPLSYVSIHDDFDDACFPNSEFVGGHVKEGIGDDKFGVGLRLILDSVFYDHICNRGFRLLFDFVSRNQVFERGKGWHSFGI